MLMFNKKSLTERALGFREKYLQPESIRRSILKITVSTLLAIKLISYCFTPVLASEPINVKEYIKQNNYNLPTIFQLYLNPLNDDGLDENEKKVIDIIANAPEEKQDELKSIAKEIYNNNQLTSDILAKIENLNLPYEKQEPVTLEQRIEKSFPSKQIKDIENFRQYADGIMAIVAEKMNIKLNKDTPQPRIITDSEITTQEFGKLLGFPEDYFTAVYPYYFHKQNMILMIKEARLDSLAHEFVHYFQVQYQKIDIVKYADALEPPAIHIQHWFKDNYMKNEPLEYKK